MKYKYNMILLIYYTYTYYVSHVYDIHTYIHTYIYIYGNMFEVYT